MAFEKQENSIHLGRADGRWIEFQAILNQLHVFHLVYPLFLQRARITSQRNNDIFRKKKSRNQINKGNYSYAVKMILTNKSMQSLLLRSES